MARINLIDLAGSERLAKSNSTGDNQKEATSINLSLTNLGIVIKALSEKKEFVPFRNSKLTFLLKDSLSGNSRTYMIATISPSESEIEETISTLRFASNVKRIVTDPHVNFGTHEDMINALRGEITKLKEQLAAAASKPDMGAQMKVRSAVLKIMDASLAKKVEKRYSNVSEGHVEDPYLMNISSDPLKTGLLTIVLPVPPSPSRSCRPIHLSPPALTADRANRLLEHLPCAASLRTALALRPGFGGGGGIFCLGGGGGIFCFLPPPPPPRPAAAA
jgi:hypothetical protein